MTARKRGAVTAAPEAAPKAAPARTRDDTGLVVGAFTAGLMAGAIYIAIRSVHRRRPPH